MDKDTPETPDGTTCDHCGRTDVGTKAAGRAVVKIPIRNPYDLQEVVGHRVLVVCDPTVKFRPRCRTLVLVHGHERACRPCALNYAPGAEAFYQRYGDVA